MLEGLEAVGLWRGRRWAEYLTFLATSLLLIPRDLRTDRQDHPTRVITLIINLAVVVYLLFAKRLFGIRGGGRAEAAEQARDSGWPAPEWAFPTA